jgi:hypothetical protein
MKINILYISIVLFSIQIMKAQQAPTGIHFLRYNDNFSALKKDSIKKGFDKLKMIPLSKNAHLSIGGELREQAQYFDNQNFGDVPPTVKKASVGQLWHRIMVHANVDMGKKARLFVQLNNTKRFFNPNPLTPEIDENVLSLHQAFADVRFNNHWQLRVGRQELSYGNNRLLTFREGPNTRMAFDGGIIKFQKNAFKIDIIGVSQVSSQPKIGDDLAFREFVGGVYATQTLKPKLLLMDYYALYYKSNLRKYNTIGGNEKRTSMGFRAFSQNPKFNYELEATYQTGRFNALTINALALSADVNYQIEDKTKLTIGIASNYITGDKNRSDKQLNTYNLLYSKPSFGLAAPIGASNIINLNPYVRIRPVPKMTAGASIYFLKRQSLADGIYSPGMAQVRRNAVEISVKNVKNIGVQYAVEVGYQINPHWAIYADAAYFEAGNYPKNTGKGLPISYSSGKISFKF